MKLVILLLTFILVGCGAETSEVSPWEQYAETASQSTWDNVEDDGQPPGYHSELIAPIGMKQK